MAMRASRIAKVGLACLLLGAAALAICDREALPTTHAGLVQSQVAAEPTSPVALVEPPPATAARAVDATVQRPRSELELQRARDRARRDDLRRRIVERQAAREAESSRGRSSGGDDEPESPPLTDRIGGRDDLARLLQGDFMPLADECVTAAQERRPGLEGMFAIEFDVLADPDVGAVVDTIEIPTDAALAADGQPWDPELVECMRESAYSLSFPPPPKGGRDEFMVSLRIGSDGDGGEAPQ